MKTISEELVRVLRNAKNVVVFTGAGVSAESGIPTFRDALTGLWERFDPQELATPEAFMTNPDLVWGWYEWRRALVTNCRPNPAHLAIAELQRFVPEVHVITQNVDNLHERAGSENVIHVHGSLHHPICSSCRTPFHIHETIDVTVEKERKIEPPKCDSCQGLIRPGVVWFGEPMPEQPWHIAQHKVLNCDLFFSIGTSSIVFPAAGLPITAHENGACVVQVNPHSTGIENVLDYNLVGKAGELLPQLVDLAFRN